MANPFDQFDAPTESNPFDQFDSPLPQAAEKSAPVDLSYALEMEEAPTQEAWQPQQQEEQSAGRGFIENLGGAVETALSVGTGVVGGVAGQMAGTVEGLAKEIMAGNYGEQEAADRIEQLAMKRAQQMTYSPRSEAGQEQLGAVGEALQPLEAIPPIAQLQALAGASRFATPQIAAGARKAAGSAGRAADSAAQILNKTPFQKRMRGIIEATKAGEAPQNEAAKYILTGTGRVAKDPLAVESIKQGFDEGVVASIKAASASDKKAMSDMMTTMEKGMKSSRYARENRPSDVVGRSIMDRFKFVRDTNRQAGKELDSVAQGLRGKPIDVSGSTSDFLGALDKMDVSTKQIDGKIIPVFEGSAIDGLAGAETAIKRMFNRMNKGGDIDAYDAHKMKRFIDEQVSYGKASGEGLTGQTERAFKTLRSSLDKALDDAYPEYDRVNTQYSDTRGALDSFIDITGKKFNPMGDNAEKQAGTLSRRILSNAQSRVPLIDSIADMERVARKYGANIEGDITTQAMFFDELERMFGSSAKTSFQGIGEKIAETALKSKAQIAGDVATGTAKKFRGVSDEKAVKSMNELLRSHN